MKRLACSAAVPAAGLLGVSPSVHVRFTNWHRDGARTRRRGRLRYIIEKAGFPANTTARKIRKFRMMGEMLEQSGSVDGQNIAASSVAATVNSYNSTAKITHAKAAFAALSAEEKAEFLKWQSA